MYPAGYVPGKVHVTVTGRLRGPFVLADTEGDK
jgi:hypothetical protein